MGGIFCVASKSDCIMDLFFGTDYHSHLGTKRGGLCVFGKGGFNRAIHNIENSPFRTKFEKEIEGMSGNIGIGSISDGEPQPLTVFSNHGEFSVSTVGRINNKNVLVNELLKSGNNQFMAMNGGEINNTELIAALISTESNIAEGIKYAQEKIDGSATIAVLTKKGIYVARDKFGRTPMIIGSREDGFCAASESFAFINLGYKFVKELGPSEIVFISPEGMEQIFGPTQKMRMCTFMWTYFGYTTSTYEGMNVEEMRYRNGANLAISDGKIDVDYVSGVPDSGVAHALGYANKSNIPYSRPLIKYTPTWPRSFMPQNQKARELIARMKLIPVSEIINGKKFVLIDDSIVRGTQLSETVKYLYKSGAKEIHVRSASPPIMFGCKYLNFSRAVSDTELITIRTIMEIEGKSNFSDIKEGLLKYADSETNEHKCMIEAIKKKLEFDSFKYHKMESTLDAIGIPKEKLCTYCFTGEE